MFRSSIILFFILTAAAYLSAKSTFSGDRLQDAIIAVINEKMDGQAEVEFISTPRTAEFQDDDIGAEVVFDANPAPGINTVAVLFTKNGKVIRYNEFTVRIKQIVKVWTAARTLSSSAVISESDLSAVYRAVDDNRQLPELSQIIGKTPNRSLQKGEMITSGLLANETLVKRGDKVSMFVECGAVRVRVEGAALQDGTAGQHIRVKRENSSAILTGKVRDDGSVVIFSDNYIPN